jgi:RNA polymerase sigma-70 factor (ECF subfamily)
MDLFTFDDAYVQRLRDGDPATEEHFYAYFRNLLSAKIRRWLRSTQSTQEIEDVLQEVYLRTLTGLDQVRETSKFGSFVNTVCTHVLQEAGRNGNRLVQLDVHFDAPGTTDLEAELETRRTQTSVRLVLASLPIREAEILRAVFIDEIPREEICRRNRIEPSYLRVRIHRAKDKFRDVFIRLFGRPPR